MTSSTEPQQTAPPPSGNKALKRLREYSVANMVFSLLAVFALAFAWWVLMPNPDGVQRREAEVVPVARYAAEQSDFPIWTPQDALSQTWTANFANFEVFAGELSWRIGVVTPKEAYAELSQTADATREWRSALTEKVGGEVGTRTITGPDGPQEWTVHEGEERALVLGPATGREATTIVRGTADWAELEEFIGLLQVASAD